MSYLKSKAGSVEETITKMSSKVVESDYQDKFKKELDKAGKGIGSMTPAEKKAFFNKIDSMHKAKDEQVSKGDIDKFHKKLDNLVHKSFGHSSDEKKMKNEEKKMEVEGGPGSGPQGNGAKKTNFTSAQIKQAYGILNDPRYRQGNYSGAVRTINKVSPGLADHPDVLKALKRANEEDEKEIAKLKEDVAKLVETHTYMTNKMNKRQKDTGGEKEVVKPIEDTTGTVKETKKMSEQTAKNFDLYRAIHSVWTNAADKLDEIKKEAKYLKPEEVEEEKKDQSTLAKPGDTESVKEKKGKTMVNSQKTMVDMEPEVDYQK